VDPEIAALMSQVDPDRLVGDVEALASFGTRHVLSVADDPGRGIGGARQWVYGRFDAANRQGSNQVAVEWEPFDLAFGGRTTEQRNVLATIPGLDRPKRFVYVVAHYDSRTVDSADGGSAAPGADDDASGVAALTELARVLATRQWKASIRLAAFAAGEAGSEGSQHHASRAAEFGLPILAVLEDQSIGGAGGPGAPDGGSVSVYAPAGAAPGEGLARYVAAVGQRYVPLEVVIVPEAATADGPGVQAVFGDAGFPAAQIAAGSADVATEHTAGDTADRLDPEYLAQVVRLNAALVANLALAPPGVTQAPAISVVPDGTQVGWQPVEHPDVAGYWIGLRAAGEARYRPLVWAGSGNETTVEAPSGWLVAVAASDDRGHVSPFSPEAEVP
jgi:Zn-dependent M28 family amino/carboxypeptidase